MKNYIFRFNSNYNGIVVFNGGGKVLLFSLNA